ncbi:MAG TPA: methanogenesis marker 8 protein [Methanomicrobiales archaeon]|nr:methanogenesis marker 8 protein [Methanomicrobiales archaeon]
MSDTGDEHVIEAIGRCRVVIRDGQVVEVGPPLIQECPLARRFAKPVVEITREAVRENVQNRIESFGMFTRKREILSERDFVLFGASELISCGIRQGLLDAAVLACEGAGTVLAPTPALVQGIGGRMSGLIRTSPIPDLIAAIEAEGGMVPDPKTARIDQAEGVRFALAKGFSRIAVTIADAKEARKIRDRFPSVLIFGVHTTGLSRDEADLMVKAADLVTACASKTVREAAGKVALMQAGTAIPVFALTPSGKEIILAKLRETPDSLLVKAEKLPFEGGRLPSPLI